MKKPILVIGFFLVFMIGLVIGENNWHKKYVMDYMDSLILSPAYAQSGQEYIRIRIDVAIPKATWDGWPQATRDTIKDRLLQIKALGQKINAGKLNEENTISVKWHICQNERGVPCPDDQEF